MTSRRLHRLAITILFGAALAAAVLVAILSRQVHEPTFAAETSPEALLAARLIDKFQKVDATLYRGAQPDARGFKELEKMGVRTVINLRKRHSDGKMLRGTSLRCKNIGMNVWHEEDEDVIAFLKTVRDRSNGPFFVHCEHGVDRTGFMCAIYRVVVQDWSKEDALAERKSFGPHKIWKNLERYIRKLDVAAMRKQAGLPSSPSSAATPQTSNSGGTPRPEPALPPKTK
jgi:protein tyrosine phosphatase (PTP) superfamily phosphohydrolase (DUF442 family)